MPVITLNSNKPEGEFILKETDKTKKKKDIPVPYPHITLATENLPHGRISPFSAFCLYPEKVTFQNQEQDETIILLLRRHFITNVPWITTALFMITLLPVSLPLLPILFPFINISAVSGIFLILFYYLVVAGFILVNFTLWYFHVALITNQRIVDVDIHGIILRDVSQTKLNLIQDVNYNQFGVIRSFFDYGDVFVQTAGTELNFEFEQAPNPAQVVEIIADLIGKHKHV